MLWEKWKNRIKNIFSEEEEFEENKEQEQEQPAQHTNLKAKVTYQYPKKRPFRFPVIPDEPEPKQETFKREEDLPAYQRRNSKKQSQFEQVERKIIEKKSDIPFEVSDVPSPIDGFKRSKEKEVDQIPAYIRRKRDKSQTDSVQEIASTVLEEESKIKTPIPIIEEQDILTVEIEKEESNKIELESRDEAVKEQKPTFETDTAMNETDNELISEVHPEENQEDKEEVTIAELEIKEYEKKEPVEEEQVQIQQPIEHPNEVVEIDQEKLNENIDTVPTEIADNQQEKQEKPQKREQEKQRKSITVPYNVIMTPIDQIKYERRKRLEKRKAQQNQYQEIHRQRQEEQAKQVSTPKFSASQEEKKEIEIPFHLLNDPVPKTNDSEIWIQEQQSLLEETLKHFHVNAKVVKATQGPAVTRFEVHPEMGVKVSKIKNLSDDLKLNMAARDIRIEAPIPGKNTVGIEIPNLKSSMVGLQEIFDTPGFKESKSPLTIALGLSIEGKPKITDIQKMPHGLIAGATGSGKSVCINTMLISLIYKAHHEEVKFLLIDPKMVELAPYNGIPHLVAPVITDVKAATQSLKWAVNEMEDRYEKFVHEGARNIEGYNKKMEQQGRNDEKMSFIVIVIDELADLMMTAPQDVEDSISRIAQKARACGIHLILATQRPSVDVITGLIKANIPTRIAFSVSSQVDSRTIIDMSGAEKLLGKGDMLFMENGAGKTVRLQGPFVSDEEIERVTNYARSIAEPNYLFEQEELLEQIHIDEEEDELFHDAIAFIIEQDGASTSMLQRHFKIGYNRAARLIDSLESKGIISGPNGSKPREVLIHNPNEYI